jgi:hypothetical protein
VNFENKLRSLGFIKSTPMVAFYDKLPARLIEVTKHNIQKLKNNLLYFSYEEIYKDDKIIIKTYKQRLNKDETFFILFTPDKNYFIIFDHSENNYEVILKFTITENFWNDILNSIPIGYKREWKLKQLFKTK